jgi:hypothetical protein
MGLTSARKMNPEVEEGTHLVRYSTEKRNSCWADLCDHRSLFPWRAQEPFSLVDSDALEGLVTSMHFSDTPRVVM